MPKIQKQYDGLGLRIRYSMVGYRDDGDGAQQFETLDFVEDPALLEAKVGWRGFDTMSPRHVRERLSI